MRSVKCSTNSVPDPKRGKGLGAPTKSESPMDRGTPSAGSGQVKTAPTLKISEMPTEERPREKLLARGPTALIDPELIAILLGSGLPGANAIDVARQLLNEHKSLSGLSRCTVDQLKKIPGIGPAKAL